MLLIICIFLRITVYSTWELKIYQVHSKDDLRVTFDIFTARSILCSHLYGENVEKSFSQNVLNKSKKKQQKKKKKKKKKKNKKKKSTQNHEIGDSV